MKKFLFIVVTAVLVFLTAELAARFAFHRIFPYGDFAVRLLRGEAGTYMRVIGQPYLNYVPAPGFENESGVQHSSHGYRGPLVEVAKDPATLRILCLGGSTTYGWGTERPDQAYPAHLEKIIASSLPDGYRKVEVINGGLPWGSSAEMLTHYHFKYHYYRPDWVVIHTGLNDAQAFYMSHYQPDYSHWRTQMRRPPLLPGPIRWLARFRLVDFVLIPSSSA